MTELLRDIDIPFEALYCNDSDCIEHYDAINKYHNDLMDVCIAAAKPASLRLGRKE